MKWMGSQVWKVGLACVWALSACGSTEPTPGQPLSAGAPDRGATTNTKDVVLASIDVGYGTVEFRKIEGPEGDTAYAILEKASAFLKTTPLTILIGSRPLTTLEVFLAVAPERQPPHELVDLHADQVLRMGRATNDVVHATFDRNAPVEKSAAACDGWVYGQRATCESWGNRLGIDFTSGTPTTWLNMGRFMGDFDYRTMFFVALGVCNETSPGSAAASEPVWGRFASRVDLGGAWSFSDWDMLSTGISARWWIDVARVGPDRCGTAGCLHAASYAVQGWGNSNHSLDLRTAEELFDTNCVH